MKAGRFAAVLGVIWLTGVSAGLPATGTPATGTPAAQSSLAITLNDGDKRLEFDWPDIRIGTGEYEAGPTGVTVIHFKKRALVAVDVRGGAPGTVNTDYVRLGYDTPELDAIVFSGGSAYGLESITAVASALKDDGVRDSNFTNVAISVGAIIYDFGDRRLNDIYPDKRLAQAAFRAARPGIIALGAHGAGRSAMSGGVFGCNAHSGQGAAFRQMGAVKIAAFVVVNAVGAVTKRDGRVAACHPDPSWPSDLKVGDVLNAMVGSPAGGPAAPEAPKRNTTVSLIVTNKRMSSVDLQRLAVQVHTSMARAIQPFATRFDGDVLYAVSTAEFEPPPGESPFANVVLDTAAAEVMWDAILSSVPEQPVMPEFRSDLHLTAKELKAFAGEYVFSPSARLRVSVEDGHLFAEASGARRVFAIDRAVRTELRPIAATQFGIPGRYPFVVSFAPGGRVIVNPGPWQQVGTRSRP